ncbi:MAG: ribonuclease P protein component [Gemmatirosa sp.]
MSPAQGFPRRHRLTRGTELDVVRREGKRVRTEHLEVRVLASLQSFLPPDTAAAADADPPRPRVGIVVPKHRQNSVARNRLKRRLRELIRLRLLPSLPPGIVVVRARPEAYGATFEQLARQIERARRDVLRHLAAPAAPVAPAAPSAPVDAPREP